MLSLNSNCDDCGKNISDGDYVYCGTCHADALRRIKDLEECGHVLQGKIKEMEAEIARMKEAEDGDRS